MESFRTLWVPKSSNFLASFALLRFSGCAAVVSLRLFTVGGIVTPAIGADLPAKVAETFIAFIAVSVAEGGVVFGVFVTPVVAAGHWLSNVAVVGAEEARAVSVGYRVRRRLKELCGLGDSHAKGEDRKHIIN